MLRAGHNITMQGVSYLFGSTMDGQKMEKI